MLETERGLLKRDQEIEWEMRKQILDEIASLLPFSKSGNRMRKTLTESNLSLIEDDTNRSNIVME